jgi:hypothetical protein
MAFLNSIGIVGFLNLFSRWNNITKSDKNTDINFDFSEKNINDFMSNSYVEYTKLLRISPIAMVDASLLHHDIIIDVQQTLLSIFSGYYLQAIAMDATVNNVSVAKMLKKLNSNEAFGIDSVSNLPIVGAGLECLDEGPKLPNLGLNIPYNKSVALETFKLSTENNKDDNKESTLVSSTTILKEIKDASNLSIGKILDLQLKRNNDVMTVPVSIRFQTASLRSDALVSLLSYGDQYITFGERWHGWRSGRLEFWRDIVLCRDLIDAHRESLMKDKTGLYKEIAAKKKSLLSKVLKSTPSIGNMSNVVVISEDTLRLLEQNIAGKIDNFKVREKLFMHTSIVLFAVVDTSRNRVKLYHHSIPTATDLTFAAIKRVSKDQSTNVVDILNAFQSGTAPVFR